MLAPYQKIYNKRVLICPLDWGIGHASRCIPIIYSLIENQNAVTIAADGLPYELLKSEFPTLNFIRFSSFRVRYSNRNNMVFKMLMSLPSILWGIFREHQLLKQIVQLYQIEVVISDNRYGLWNEKINSIFITHQIMVKMPNLLKFLEYPIYLLNRWFINHYNQCWIPDADNENNLSGDLSHLYPLPKNSQFIGYLSRFSVEYDRFHSTLFTNVFNFDVLVLLSGPEPQRTILENIFLEKLQAPNTKSLIIRGLPSSDAQNNLHFNGNCVLMNHVTQYELKQLIMSSKQIYCRSGYSTLMDLEVLQKEAILIPTPSQTEQEYLAKYLITKGKHKTIAQKDLKNVVKFGE